MLKDWGVARHSRGLDAVLIWLVQVYGSPANTPVVLSACVLHVVRGPASIYCVHCIQITLVEGREGLMRLELGALLWQSLPVFG